MMRYTVGEIKQLRVSGSNTAFKFYSKHYCICGAVLARSGLLQVDLESWRKLLSTSDLIK